MIRALGESYRESFSGLPRAVWVLAFVAFVNRSGTMVVPFLALYLSSQMGYGVGEAGTILSLYGLGSVGGSYLGGWLSDHLGPRRVMMWSLTLGGSGFLLLGTLESRAAISFMVLALSLVGDGFRPATAAAMGESAPAGDRTRALAMARLAMNLGMFFGPAAGGFLAGWSYVWLFIVDGGTCLLAAALLIAAFRGHGRAPRAEETAGRGPGRSPWRDAIFLRTIFFASLLAAVLFQIFGTWPLYLHKVDGVSEAGIGILFSINTLAIVAFQMPLLHGLRRRPPLAVAGIGAFLFCGGLALLPFGRGYAWVVVTVLVWTVGELLSLPFIEGFVAERADERTRGRYMGLFTLSYSVSFVIAPLVGTWIYESLAPDAVWYACGLAGVVLWVGLASLSRRAAEITEPAVEAGTP